MGHMDMGPMHMCKVDSTQPCAREGLGKFQECRFFHSLVSTCTLLPPSGHTDVTLRGHHVGPREARDAGGRTGEKMGGCECSGARQDKRQAGWLSVIVSHTVGTYGTSSLSCEAFHPVV